MTTWRRGMQRIAALAMQIVRLLVWLLTFGLVDVRRTTVTAAAAAAVVAPASWTAIAAAASLPQCDAATTPARALSLRSLLRRPASPATWSRPRRLLTVLHTHNDTDDNDNDNDNNSSSGSDDRSSRRTTRSSAVVSALSATLRRAASYTAGVASNTTRQRRPRRGNRSHDDDSGSDASSDSGNGSSSSSSSESGGSSSRSGSHGGDGARRLSRSCADRHHRHHHHYRRRHATSAARSAADARELLRSTLHRGVYTAKRLVRPLLHIETELDAESDVGSTSSRRTDRHDDDGNDNDNNNNTDDHNDKGSSRAAPSPSALRALLTAQRRRAQMNSIIRDCLRAAAAADVQTTLLVHACTWNVDQTPPPPYGVDFLTWLLGHDVARTIAHYDAQDGRDSNNNDNNSSEASASLLRPLPDEVLRQFPDVLVVTLQEVDMGGVALVRESTASSVTWTAAILRLLHTAVRGQVTYRKLKVVQLVGLVLIVLARAPHVDYVAHVRLSLTRTGAMRLLGNKGAVCMRATIYGKRFLFVAAHFVAHTHNETRRRRDYYAAVRDIRFDMPSGTDDESEVLRTFIHADWTTTSLYARSFVKGRSAWDRLLGLQAVMRLPRRRRALDELERRALDAHDYVFFLGDLNSRLHALSHDDLHTRLRQREYDYLLCHDELRQGMVSGAVFDGFEEPRIDFAPTYKFVRGGGDYDTRPPLREPAWCDRVLFRVLQTPYNNNNDNNNSNNNDSSHEDDKAGESRGSGSNSHSSISGTTTTTATTAVGGGGGCGNNNNSTTCDGSFICDGATSATRGCASVTTTTSPVAATSQQQQEDKQSCCRRSRRRHRCSDAAVDEDDGSAAASPWLPLTEVPSLLLTRGKTTKTTTVAADDDDTSSGSGSRDGDADKYESSCASASSTDTVTPHATADDDNNVDAAAAAAHVTATTMSSTSTLSSSSSLSLRACATNESTFHAAQRPHNAHTLPPPPRFPMVANRAVALAYYSVDTLTQSDHRPVCAQFAVNVVRLTPALVAEVQETLRAKLSTIDDDASALFDVRHGSPSSDNNNSNNNNDFVAGKACAVAPGAA